LADATDIGILGDVARYASSALGDAAKASLGLAGNLLSGSSKLSDYSEALAVNTPLLKEFSTVVKGLVKFAEQNLEDYEGLASMGASFDADTTRMRTAATKMGLTMEQMTEMVANNREGLAAFGGTVNQSMTDLINFNNQILTSDTGTYLRRLGMNFQDVNDTLIAYQEIMEAGGRGNSLTELQRQQAVEEFATGIDELVKLTGKNRKEIMEEMKERRRSGEMQAFLNTLGPEQAAAVQEQINTMQQTLGPVAAQAFQEILAFGAPINEATQNFVAGMGGAATDMYAAGDLFRSGNLDAFAAQTDNAIGAMTDYQNSTEFAQTAMLGGVGGPVAEAQASALEGSYVFRNRMAELAEETGSVVEAMRLARQQIAEEQNLQRTAGDSAPNLIAATQDLQEATRQLAEATQQAAFPRLEEAGLRAIGMITDSLPPPGEVASIVANTADNLFNLAERGIYGDIDTANMGNVNIGSANGELTPGDVAGLGASGTPDDPLSVTQVDPAAEQTVENIEALDNRTAAVNDAIERLRGSNDAMDATRVLEAEQIMEGIVTASAERAAAEETLNEANATLSEAIDTGVIPEIRAAQDAVNAAEEALNTKIEEETQILNDALAATSDMIRSSMEYTNRQISRYESDPNFVGGFDSGGNIPSGAFGMVGEYGPELIGGPANVVGRRETSQMISSMMRNISSLADLPQMIQDQTVPDTNVNEITTSSNDRTMQALGSLFSRLEGKLDQLITIEARLSDTGVKTLRATRGLTGNLHRGIG